MSIQRSMVRGIAVMGAAASAAVMAPSISSAAPAHEAGTTQQSAPMAVQGANAVSHRYYGGTLRGTAGFQAYDEILFACDRRADGRKVFAQLYWGGRIRAAVLDRNGAKSPCYGVDLNLREGTPVWVRVGVEGVGYGPWDRGTA